MCMRANCMFIHMYTYVHVHKLNVFHYMYMCTDCVCMRETRKRLGNVRSQNFATRRVAAKCFPSSATKGWIYRGKEQWETRDDEDG